MNKNDYNKFAKDITLLAEIHGKTISSAMIGLYFKTMEKFDIVDVNRAINGAASTLKFFPKPAELIELIGGKVEDRAEVELAKVIDAVRKHGAYSSIVFDDPVTMAVIQQGFGGWIKMCEDMLENEIKWFRKDFVKVYQAYHAQSVKTFGKLLGVHESQSRIEGREYSSGPVLIGDPSKANKVLEYKPEKAPSEKIMRLISGIGGKSQ